MYTDPTTHAHARLKVEQRAADFTGAQPGGRVVARSACVAMPALLHAATMLAHNVHPTPVLLHQSHTMTGNGARGAPLHTFRQLHRIDYVSLVAFPTP